MAGKQGSLSINSENIFPIIKKWLYSDHDIFIRELISNGSDAITKLKKLDVIGEYSIPEGNEFKIRVIADAENKTLTFIDNGIGMTAGEVDEYINQIAFSGAEAFLEHYKGKADEEQIIGHFGLGFYSAFMVSEKVTIDSLSYREGAEAVHWDCDGSTEYTMDKGDRTERGTTITLYLNEDSLEFANEYRVHEVLDKYCSFMPVEIYLENPNAEPHYDTVDPDEVTEKDTVIENIVIPAETQEIEKEDGAKETIQVSPEKNQVKILRRPVSISDTAPLWTKHPNECTEEEYIAFYRKVFSDYKKPLFWIHLNMDYPFNLKGILYFPKVNNQYESLEGTIKLFNNQVFIADNIKEVIPEFLMLLKGVIDCPDLPLNVSRSALQNDGFVRKISDYISKKVADKLTGMCKTEKDEYIKYWDDISPFIKFGCLKDEKFAEKINDCILFKNLDNEYLTLKECLEKNEEKHKNVIFYITDEVAQSQYINMFREENIDAVRLTHSIDSAFITQLEHKNEDVKFLRIDTALNESLREEIPDADKEAAEAEEASLTELFRKALENENLNIKMEYLKNKNISSMITVSEESHRMQEMFKMYAMDGIDAGMFGAEETLVLNANNQLVRYILANRDSEHVDLICRQLYDLAAISKKQLTPEAMTEFIARSNEIMMLLTK
ncbi:molecular chaperone HtpG [Parasporobacterium paucivorans]|uniref:Molecular chaperone HtpG n=1 Tax=Parasporobacterium paucivorans DSM 15970 TaxID=1122934 RepID=A0A1M6C3L8_9FIRM|nr:molecular chaperone HtpG [Parasporobacterium paucivorans]SHI55364.1 molecular chaperone HtpG [Parasporobacterium paucivorans DSM 15970]